MLVKQIFLMGMCLYSTIVFASQRNPLPCKTINFNIRGNSLVLNVHPRKAANIFILKNKSQATIMLDHPDASGSAKAGWASTLDTGKASAILIDKRSFSLTCTMKLKSQYRPVSCNHVLEVCQSIKRFPGKEHGNYWLIENVSQKILQQWKYKNFK